MSTSPERKLQKWILEELKKKKQSGLPLFFWKISDSVRAGLPDLAVVFRGHFCGIELKSPGRKASKLQELTLKEIRDAGGVSAVVDSKEAWNELWFTFVELVTPLYP